MEANQEISPKSEYERMELFRNVHVRSEKANGRELSEETAQMSFELTYEKRLEVYGGI